MIFFKNISQKDKIVLSAAVLGLFWISSCWGFWSHGIYSLGINHSIFGLLLLGFLSMVLPGKIHNKKNLAWILPLLFIFLGSCLFENPFLKIINLIILPIIITIICSILALKDRDKKQWGPDFFYHTVGRFFAILENIPVGVKNIASICINQDKKQNKIFLKSLAGIGIFFAIALIVIVPLLSSADAIFANYMKDIITAIKDFFAGDPAQKILFFLFLFIIFSAIGSAWKEGYTFKAKSPEKSLDSVISGIVLGGTLLLYLLFIVAQIDRIWISDLPQNFSLTEELVKNGFWQLLFLSFLNIIAFIVFYKKTSPFVQKLLFAFSASSLLLLFSAAQRVSLYAYYYGLSYEKFFAAYTVLFCITLFSIILYFGISKKNINISKIIIGLFLWMYGIANIAPLEMIIFKTNLILSQKENSRVVMSELSMLSNDVFSLVKKHISVQKNHITENPNEIDSYNIWRNWTNKQITRIEEKKWYEKNIPQLFLSHKDLHSSHIQ